MAIPSFPPREVSDEMLQRVGLTRERFERMIVEPTARSCPLAALNLFGEDFASGSFVWRKRRT